MGDESVCEARCFDHADSQSGIVRDIEVYVRDLELMFKRPSMIYSNGNL